MCGIAGLLHFDSERPAAEATLAAMLATLVHRGPDDEGRFVEGPAALGMRRLSIIDLAGGHQPIFNEDESCLIVFNGEVYNYLELRAELEPLGHVFRTNSDTETILHGYEQWGVEVLQRLNGMFAFAIWDRRRQELLLARDRVGIKPLFYAADPQRLVFGSELKAVLAAGVAVDLDPWAVNQFFSHWYVPTPRSIYRQVHKLEPGCWLRASPAGWQSGRYWNMTFDPQPPTAPPEVWDEELRAVLAQAVRHQMRSDVEVGAFLSGGLDSSLVTSFMAPLTSHRLKTYTIGFAERSYAEQDIAERIAAQIGTDHHTELLTVAALTEFPRLVAHFDEPFGDYSLLPTWAVSQLARQSVKVVLTGDGGDECFAGYPTHYVWRYARLWRRLPGGLRRGLQALAARLPTSYDRISLDYALKRFSRGAELDYRRGHHAWKEILTADERRALFVPGLWEQVAADDPYQVFERYFDEVRDQPVLNQLLYADMKTFLLDDNLVKVDRMSMAASIEVRVPLLDNAVLDFVARVPVEYKLPGRQSKPLLRRLARRQLPPGVSGLKKRGFTPPLPIWLRADGGRFLREALSPANIAATGLFQPAAVQRMVDEHLAGVRDWNRPLFGLLSFVCWQQSRG
ncbi:MAG: asparagine synthase (glutamine-hydrolyzing) [Fimbriimonadaceae bacterium]|nr:asparagine synthase (glutamine-hydrolyzing) [Fimbriimonadaceae bacterium]